jgi:hypothetical protein
LASGGTGLGALASSFLDHVKGSTDDSTLRLDDTAGTLLGDFLFSFRQHVFTTVSSGLS